MKQLALFLIGLGNLVLTAVILGLTLMLLWNWLMPEIFGLPEINFWKSLGLLLLSGILIKNNSK